MRDFLKRLFAKPEPESVSISFESLPALFAEREADASSTLASAAAGPVGSIRSGMVGLLQVVQTIENAEHDPAIHPKLKSIAKNTLPQFTKSMKTALSRELPDDPEEFYPAAVEMVKGCLNSMRGPGRYLTIVFPDEMKAIKASIDTMGREINTLTGALATFRTASGTIADARADLTAIGKAEDDLNSAVERSLRISRRIAETTDRVAAIGRELEALRANPSMKEAEAARAFLIECEANRDATARAYASLSMTASHVFRKAEKIANRKMRPGETAALRQVMGLLSDHEAPDPGALEQSLATACPVTSRMIDDGEIPLRNKEERAIFGDVAHFTGEICGTCRRLTDDEEACRKAKETLDTHPALVRQNSLERERTQLLAMIDKETAEQEEIAAWQQSTKERFPAMHAELAKKVGAIMGKNVQWQDTQDRPA
jgi:hypothetical protein